MLISYGSYEDKKWATERQISKESPQICSAEKKEREERRGKGKEVRERVGERKRGK